jgi:hypothetical protein
MSNRVADSSLANSIALIRRLVSDPHQAYRASEIVDDGDRSVLSQHGHVPYRETPSIVLRL